MDLKLTKFLDEEFAKLTDEEVQAFKVLAEMEDLDLWSLIASDRQAPDPRLTGILAKLRKC